MRAIRRVGVLQALAACASPMGPSGRHGMPSGRHGTVATRQNRDAPPVTNRAFLAPSGGMTAHPTSKSARNRSRATFTYPKRLHDVVPGDPPQLRETHGRGPASEQGPVGEPHDDLLTVAEAGDYLGTGERFIRRLVAQRRIPYIKLGKYVRRQRSALDAFIAAGRVPSN